MPNDLLRRLLGSAAMFAPEDDDGATFEDVDPDDLDLELEDEPDEPAEGDVEVPQGGADTPAEPARSRGSNRVAEATRIAAEAKARADSLQAELDRERAQRNQVTQQQTAAQEQERLRLMSPDERTDYLVAKARNETKAELEQIRFETRDSADRTAFEGLCARNPVAAKLKPEVESYLVEMRKNGTTAPRETVLKYVIGERALAKAPAARTRQTTRAAAATTANAARPAGGRSDAPASTGRSANEREARAKRLEGVKL